MKRILAFVLLLSMLLALAPVSACADGAWKKNGSGWWYQNEDGSYPAGCIQEIGGKRYYFNASGYMQTGWQKIEGRWYSFDGSGAMRTGWQKIDGSWYYFDASGVMLTGLQTIGSARYWLGGSGAMRTGWQQIGGSWYYFGDSGAMQTGWVKLGGKWYYLDDSGVMQTGWRQIGGSWYSFDASGAMRTGWVKSAGQWYYMSSSGAMQTGWQKVGGKWYFFSDSGVMQTGWHYLDDTWYELNYYGGYAKASQPPAGYQYTDENYRELYQPILDRYKQYINSGESGVNATYKYGVSECCSSEVGFCFLDVDGNGVKELILETPRDEFGLLLDLYTIWEGAPIRICVSGFRSREYLLDDMRILNEGSNGAAYSIVTVYSYYGNKRTEADGIRSSDRNSPTGQILWYRTTEISGYNQYPDSAHISREEAESLQAEWENHIIIPDLNLIS